MSHSRVINALMIRHRLTSKQLAAKTGLSLGTIYNLLKPHHPFRFEMRTASKVAQALSVGVYDIFHPEEISKRGRSARGSRRFDHKSTIFGSTKLHISTPLTPCFSAQ